MLPLITSEGIKSIVKIAELLSGELLLASSQLGLVSITRSHESINLIHQKEQVLSEPLIMKESEILKVQASDANELHVVASILQIQPREVTT